MTNLNLELIEKVKSGKAAIEHTQKKEDNKKLQSVLIAAFPNSTVASYLFEEKYYGQAIKGSNKEEWDIYVTGEEQNLEIISLSAFFTSELPKDNLSLIAQIDARLKHYNLIQPIDTTEGEKQPQSVTVGTGKQNHLSGAQPLAQEQGKEWKVGEWAWNNNRKNMLALIVNINGNKVQVDNQDGKIEWWCNRFIIETPTPEEIQAHLVAIAEKKYPVGAKVKFGKFTKEISVPLCFKYKYGNLECADFEYWTPTNGWAEIVAPIETEQRWEPKLLEVYYYINEQFKVSNTIVTHYDLDSPRILAGNCFKTEQEAQKAAEAIKQYLSNNF
jgi:hypothetical protein